MEWNVLAEMREWALLIFAVIQIAAVAVGYLVSRTLVTHDKLTERIKPLGDKIDDVDGRVSGLEKDIQNVPGWSTLNRIKENIGKVDKELAELRVGVEGLHSSQEETRADVRRGHGELRDDLRRIEDFLLDREKDK